MASDGKTIELTFAPGINKNSTNLDSEGYFTSCDKVRTRYGKFEKLGGWVSQPMKQVDDTSTSVITGVARDIQVWNNNVGDVTYIGVGTHKKVELITKGKIYDMTPLRVVTTVSAALTTSVGSTDVIVSIPSHDAAVGDYVVFGSVGTTVGGIDMSGEHVVKEVTGTNSFLVSAPTIAAATSVGGGGDLTASFLLPIGRRSNSESYGYGVGTYGTSTYGTPRGSGKDIDLRQWQFDNWGEDWLANIRGGKIYYWDVDTGYESIDPDRSDVRMTELIAAPSLVNTIVVSQPDRHLVAYGCNASGGTAVDPMLVRWSNQEDFTTWSAATSVFGGNTAGSQRLKGGAEIITAVPTKNETLIFTNSNIHVQRYIGGDFTFGFDEVAQNVGIMSQHSAVDVNGTVLWMGDSSFYTYNGVVQVLPSTLHKNVFNPDSDQSVNFNQKEKVFAGVNKGFNEIWWFYPSRDSENIDRYVIFNYGENTWYDGTIDRTVWADKGILDTPYAVDSGGNLYAHEIGKNDDASAMESFVESSWIDIEDGKMMSFIDRYIPDFMQIPTGKKVDLYVTTKKYPQSSQSVEKGPYSITNTTEKISLRARGRVVKYKYHSNSQDGDFQVGAPRVRIKPDGER